MPERDESDGADQIIGRGLKFADQIWPLIGNDLPRDVDERIMNASDRLGSPEEWADETARRVGFVNYVYDGLLAAQYHRDNIERIERELVRRLREVYPEGSEPEGGSIAAVLPVVAHEYTAYVMAARRTLEYLAQALGEMFGVRRVFRIKHLGRRLVDDGEPKDLAAKAAALSETFRKRFPELVGPDGGGPPSDRDQAAHYSPIAPAHLSVVFFRGGQVGIELRDAGRRTLPPTETLDPERMSRDEPILKQAIDARLADLHEFCGDLIDLAIEAEEWRLVQEGKQA
jgi:hypothetical protein